MEFYRPKNALDVIVLSIIMNKFKILHIFIFLKVYYHLGSFEDSLMFALGAGNMFDVNGHSEFVETTIG